MTIPELANRLTQGNCLERLNAIRELEQSRDPRAEEVLRTALKDDDPQTRQAAYKSLDRLCGVSPSKADSSQIQNTLAKCKVVAPIAPAFNGADSPSPILPIALIVLMPVYGIVQIWAGVCGIAHHLGPGWAAAALLALFALNFSIPVTIGCFFCALNVWGWPWYGALIFAAPGFLLLPLMISDTLATKLRWFRS